MITKPETKEYHEFYGTYVKLVVDEEDIVAFLTSQRDFVIDLFEALNSEALNYAYEEGKWTLMQVFRHIIDTERILGYRALCMARNDQAILPGFDQDDYVQYANDMDNNLQDLVTEFIQIRNSNISMIKNFHTDVLQRRGTVNNAPWTPRAGIYIIAGHVQHHMNVIQERYL